MAKIELFMIIELPRPAFISSGGTEITISHGHPGLQLALTLCLPTVTLVTILKFPSY